MNNTTEYQIRVGKVAISLHIAKTWIRESAAGVLVEAHDNSGVAGALGG